MSERHGNKGVTASGSVCFLLFTHKYLHLPFLGRHCHVCTSWVHTWNADTDVCVKRTTDAQSTPSPGTKWSDDDPARCGHKMWNCHKDDILSPDKWHPQNKVRLKLIQTKHFWEKEKETVKMKVILGTGKNWCETKTLRLTCEPLKTYLIICVMNGPQRRLYHWPPHPLGLLSGGEISHMRVGPPPTRPKEKKVSRHSESKCRRGGAVKELNSSWRGKQSDRVCGPYLYLGDIVLVWADVGA